MIFKKADGSVNQEMIMNYIKELKDWEYEIIPFKKDRTSQQNRYLWWVVYKTLSDYTWYDVEYIHQQLGWLFLVDYETYKKPYIRSTASLNRQEFAEYVDKIVLWASEYWVHIPTAEEYFNSLNYK